MFKKSAYILMISVFSLGTVSLARAQSVCSSDYLDCDPAEMDLANKEKSFECLERYYACGRFEVAIESLKQNYLEPEQRYLRGASYFSLYAKTSAHSARCYYLSRARTDLMDYVSHWRKELENPETLLTKRNLSYLYNAALLLKSAERLELGSNAAACPEEPMTAPEIEGFVENYLNKRIEDFLTNKFLPVPLDEITAAMSSQLSKAVEAENKLRLGLISIDGLTTKTDYLNDTLLTGLNSSVDTLYDIYGADDSTEKVFIESIEKEYNKKVSSMSPEDYEKTREEKIKEASKYLNIGTEVYNFLTEDGGYFENSSIEGIEHTLSEANDLQVIKNSLKIMQSDLLNNAYPPCGKFSTPWWCR